MSMTNDLEVLPGETCVNCNAEVWRDDEPLVVCSSPLCGIVHVRQSSEYATIYECISCNFRRTAWIDDPPYHNADPDYEDCPPTHGEHDWMLIKQSTVDLTQQDV